MGENKVLSLVYTFFLGLLIALFVGFGVDTFYAGPTMPEYPSSLNTYGKDQPSAEQLAKQKEYDQKFERYNKDQKPYNRNVSIIVLVASVLLMAASIAYERRIQVIANGVMMGGLFSLLYSIGRGLASEDSKYVFVVLCVGLAIVLYLGYRRFVTPVSTPPNAKLIKKK